MGVKSDIIAQDGSVSEWFKEHAWKACVRATVPEVRILSLPPSKYSSLNFSSFARQCSRASLGENPNLNT